MKFKVLFTIFLLKFTLVSSAEQIQDNQNNPGRPNITKKSKGQKTVIGDELNWYSREDIDDMNQRKNSLAVGHLNLPARMASCTAFFINENTLMTNHHCVTRATDLKQSSVSFYDEQDERVKYKCQKFVGSNFYLDYSLIQCEGKPGLKHGYLSLDDRSPAAKSRTSMYVVQENCNYKDDPYCNIDRYISYGDIVEVKGNRVKHLADTLGGSSGSPIISTETHKVVALHNAGANANAEQVNGRVTMSYIIKDIKKKFPQIKFYTKK